MITAKTILVPGGGIGGVVVASRLRKGLPHEHSFPHWDATYPGLSLTSINVLPPPSVLAFFTQKEATS